MTSEDRQWWGQTVLGIGAIALGIYLLAKRKHPLNPVFTPISIIFTSDVQHEKEFTFDVMMEVASDILPPNENQSPVSRLAPQNYLVVEVYLVNGSQETLIHTFPHRRVSSNMPQPFKVPHGKAKRGNNVRVVASGGHRDHDHTAQGGRPVTG